MTIDRETGLSLTSMGGSLAALTVSVTGASTSVIPARS